MKNLKEYFEQPAVLVPEIPMLRLIQAAFLTGIIIFMMSCNDDDDTNVVFKATLNGASEVPANASTATGSATLTYNRDTKIFNIQVDFTGLTPTMGHIHKAAVGVSGGVVFPFTNPVVSPVNYTSPVLDSAKVADLFAGLYYVNLHTTAFGGGEIRGQLIEQ